MDSGSVTYLIKLSKLSKKTFKIVPTLLQIKKIFLMHKMDFIAFQKEGMLPFPVQFIKFQN